MRSKAMWYLAKSKLLQWGSYVSEFMLQTRWPWPFVTVPLRLIEVPLMDFRRLLIRVLPILALTTAIVTACGQPPFDATSPWQPTQSTEGRSYRGGLQSRAPRDNFAAFNADRTTDDLRESYEAEQEAAEGEDVNSEQVPSAGGENPWATRPDDPVVLVCYGNWLNDAEEVRAEARRLCPDNTTDMLLEAQDTFWNGCPLLQPNRAAFRCQTDITGSSTSTDEDGA